MFRLLGVQPRPENSDAAGGALADSTADQVRPIFG
jgi:hypothetical protein